MSAHAELAPSAANRWMNCTASVAFCAGAVSEDENDWSIEGTDAHEKLELWLRLGVPPTDGILYGHLEHAFEYALSLEQRGYDVFFEKRLTYNAQIWGTGDIVGVRGRALALGDYKHGYRVVDVFGNAQLLTYGISAEVDFGRRFTETEFTIIQPRPSHIDGPVRTWKPEENSSITTLEWHRINVETTLRDINAGNVRFRAGKHCKFCPQEGNCKMFANWVSALVTGEDRFKDSPDSPDMDLAEDLI